MLISIFIILIIIGFAYGVVKIIISGTKSLKQWLYLKKKGISTTGQVLSVKETLKEYHGEGELINPISYLLTIKFRTVKEEFITVECSRDKYFYKENMSVPILYNPHKPNSFLLNDKTAYELLKEILLVLFFLFSYLGIIYVLLNLL